MVRLRVISVPFRLLFGTNIRKYSCVKLVPLGVKMILRQTHEERLTLVFGGL